MNYREHFHSLKTVVYFQPVFTNKLSDWLIYSTANEQVGELKHINYNYQPMISGVNLRWIIFAKTIDGAIIYYVILSYSSFLWSAISHLFV